MRTILTLLAFVIMTSVQSQIVLEHQYSSTGSTHYPLMTTYLDGYGFKYYQNDLDNSVINVYNLNHTLFRTINVPFIMTTAFNEYQVYYLTNMLFDNDSSNIEYIWFGMNTSNKNFINVVNETGNILFTDSAFYFWGNNSMFSFNNILQTDSGAKMILDYHDSTTKVFSLPGNLPCLSCSDLLPNSNQIKSINPNDLLNIFPNPNSGDINIEYKISGNYKNSEIIIIDINGIEIKRLKIDKPNDKVLVSDLSIPAGVYMIYLRTNKGLISAKKMIYNK